MSNFDQIENDDHLFAILAESDDDDGEECPSDKFCDDAHLAAFPDFVDLSGLPDPDLMDSPMDSPNFIHPMCADPGLEADAGDGAQVLF